MSLVSKIVGFFSGSKASLPVKPEQAVTIIDVLLAKLEAKLGPNRPVLSYLAVAVQEIVDADGPEFFAELEQEVIAFLATKGLVVPAGVVPPFMSPGK